MLGFSPSKDRGAINVEWSALNTDSEAKVQAEADVVEAKLRVSLGPSCSCRTCSVRENFDWSSRHLGKHYCPLLKIAISTLPGEVTCDYWTITR